FPFEIFGMAPRDLLNLVTHAPNKAGAFVRTFLEIGQTYDMSVEHFLFAALRSYQKMHQNYFEELERAAVAFIHEHGLSAEPPVDSGHLQSILREKFGTVVEEATLQRYPQLSGFRSVWIEGSPAKLLLNGNLLPSQKAFILGREIGYDYLDLKERAVTSSWLKVESFEQVLDNFKASYFAGALLINENLLRSDLREFFHNQQWRSEQFLAMMKRFHATPEMFLYRLSQLIPRHFGLTEIYYLRFNNKVGTDTYRLTKELNMSRVRVPHGIGLNEHYCRRWLSVSLLNELGLKQQQGNQDEPIVAAQRSRFVESDAEFFTITLARPLALTEGTNSSISLGFLINSDFQKAVRFWKDASIPQVEVNETCERCGLSEAACPDRTVPPEIFEQEQKQKNLEQQLQKLMQEMRQN
ncbi:MAG: XRE family transcriptional regulator, partial [bacterium]